MYLRSTKSRYLTHMPSAIKSSGPENSKLKEMLNFRKKFEQAGTADHPVIKPLMDKLDDIIDRYSENLKVKDELKKAAEQSGIEKFKNIEELGDMGFEDFQEYMGEAINASSEAVEHNKKANDNIEEGLDIMSEWITLQRDLMDKELSGWTNIVEKVENSASTGRSIKNIILVILAAITVIATAIAGFKVAKRYINMAIQKRRKLGPLRKQAKQVQEVLETFHEEYESLEDVENGLSESDLKKEIERFDQMAEDAAKELVALEDMMAEMNTENPKNDRFKAIQDCIVNLTEQHEKAIDTLSDEPPYDSGIEKELKELNKEMFGYISDIIAVANKLK